MASRATLPGTAWRAALTCQAREVDRRCVDEVDIEVVAAAGSVAVVEGFVVGAEAANTPAAAQVARPERATSAARRVISNATVLSARCLLAELPEELPVAELPEAEL